MRISARGGGIAVIGCAILAGPLAWVPSASAVAGAAAAQVTVAVVRQPTDTQMMLQAARQYAAGLRHLHGAAFEQAFMGAMIPHHAAAVAMARLELTHGSHPQLKALVPTRQVGVFDQTGTDSAVKDFTSFDGVSFPLG